MSNQLLDAGALEHAVKPPMSKASGSKVRRKQKDSSIDRKVGDMIGPL
jgi:hypothetical protein